MEIKNLPNISGTFHKQAHGVQKNLQVLKTADADNFEKVVNSLVKHGYRLAWLFGTDDRAKDKTFGIHAILSPDSVDHHNWVEVYTGLPEADPRYPALTNTIMGAIWFEKYMMDMFGVVAEGHPDPRRLVHHENVPLNTHPLRKDFAWNTVMKKENNPHPMMQVEGNGIYQIPVGPIHAGIIEPGHFRFSVAGERIINLEGKLFFTHKGVEKLVEGKSVQAALPYIERLSDDSAASNAWAFVQAVELIAGHENSDKINLLRTLVAELERMTMHIHDLANIAGMGTGYTIMAAHGFRIKENLVRLSEKVFGNRFWRGFIVPGGVNKDLDHADLKSIEETTKEVMEEMRNLLKIGLESDGLMERMETSGVLKEEAARAYGAVGLPARASNVKIDVRTDHPYAAYGKLNNKLIYKTAGDVLARYVARAEELENSFEMIKEILELLPKAAGKTKMELALKDGEALGAVESWRGEMLQFVRLNEKGHIDRFAVRDPSFCNWPLFGEIGPGNIVPDFPLCNKSLNLSYSGNDM